MARANTKAGEPEHPSRDVSKVAVTHLLYGLVAPPLAWIASQIACSSIALEACRPSTGPLAEPAFTGLHNFLIVALCLSLAISGSAAAVAYQAWTMTKTEHSGGKQTLLEIGEGRSRFMAFAGLLTSFGFITASLFSVLALVLVRGC